MEPNFTNEDLEQMLAESISELTSLGYEVLPVTSIQFTNRNSRYRYGFCKIDDKLFYFDPYAFQWVGDLTVYIRITGNLRYLPPEKRSNLKTLVMHETIHAIKAPEPANGEKVFRLFDTPHGDRFDSIRDRVERELGYQHIHDGTCCGLIDFLPKQYEITAASKRKTK